MWRVNVVVQEREDAGKSDVTIFQKAAENHTVAGLLAEEWTGSDEDNGVFRAWWLWLRDGLQTEPHKRCSPS